MSSSTERYPSVVKWIAGIAVVLVLLPVLLQFVLIRVISSTGYATADIDDVDLNLFTGELAVDDVELTRDDSSVLRIGSVKANLGWLHLFTGEVFFQHLSVDKVRFTVTQNDDGSWQIIIPIDNKETTAEKKPEAENKTPVELPKIAMQYFQLNDVGINIASSSANGNFVIQSLALTDVSTWEDITSSLSVKAAWNNALINLNVTAEPLAAQPTVKGTLQFTQFPLASINVAPVQQLQGNVSVDLSFDGLIKDSGSISFSANTTSELTDVSLRYGSLDISHKLLKLQAGLDADVVEDSFQYDVNAGFESSALSIVDHIQQLSLLNWTSLDVSGLSVDHSQNISFDQLSINGIDAINMVASVDDKNNQQQGRLYTGKASISKLTMVNGDRLVIDSFDVDSGQYQVLIQKDGSLQLASILNSVIANFNKHSGMTNETQAVASDDISNTTAKPLTVAIHSISVGGTSFVELQDLRFDVPFNEKIFIEKLLVQGIDQSQADKIATLAFSSKVGEFSKINIDGKFKPFSSTKSLTLSGNLESIPLPR